MRFMHGCFAITPLTKPEKNSYILFIKQHYPWQGAGKKVGEK